MRKNFMGRFNAIGPMATAVTNVGILPPTKANTNTKTVVVPRPTPLRLQVCTTNAPVNLFRKHELPLPLVLTRKTINNRSLNNFAVGHYISNPESPYS
jgi:hypothetical protein